MHLPRRIHALVLLTTSLAGCAPEPEEPAGVPLTLPVSDSPITLPDTGAEERSPFHTVDQEASIRFRNMATTLGIEVRRRGWGIGWTDIEGDGTLDLWFTNHARNASLYRQDAEGLFTDIAAWYANPDEEGCGFDHYDAHGIRFLGAPTGAKTIWEDTGGSGAHMRWTLADTCSDAADAGLDHPGGRGRYSYWFDADGDDDLDAYLMQDHSTTLGTSASLATAGADTYTLTDIGSPFIRGLMWLDLDGDDTLDVQAWTHYDFLGLEIPDYASEALPADFDHDGEEELLVFFDFTNFTRDIVQPTPEVIQLAGGGRNTEESLTFFTTGQITWTSNFPSDVTVESHGDGTHTVRHTYGATSRSIGTRIEGNEPLIMQSYSHMEHLSALWAGPEGGVVYLDRVDGVWTERALPDGLRFCVTGATLDMDNDGDLDVYLGCQRPAINLRDQWLVNDGTGTFELLHNNGPVYEEGSQGYIATGDYDRDGRVDVAVGANNQPARWPLGRVSVLHNETLDAGNHVRLVLDGPMAHTVGAKVELTTTSHTQTRWYRAGQNHYSHNEQVLHFGIGPATEASVTITWPNGSSGTYDVAAGEELVVLRPANGPGTFPSVVDTGTAEQIVPTPDTAVADSDAPLLDSGVSAPETTSPTPDTATTVVPGESPSTDSGTPPSETGATP